jgi:hypothetical protein
MPQSPTRTLMAQRAFRAGRREHWRGAAHGTGPRAIFVNRHRRRFDQTVRQGSLSRFSRRCRAARALVSPLSARLLATIRAQYMWQAGRGGKSLRVLVACRGGRGFGVAPPNQQYALHCADIGINAYLQVTRV